MSERTCRLARHAARNDERKANGVGELIGADAGAVAERGGATLAPDFAFFIFGFAIMGAAAQLGYVTEVGNVRPVFLENEAGGRVNFGKGDGAEAGGFKPQGEPADAAEQVKVGGFIHYLCSLFWGMA